MQNIQNKIVRYLPLRTSEKATEKKDSVSLTLIQEDL